VSKLKHLILTRLIFMACRSIGPALPTVHRKQRWPGHLGKIILPWNHRPASWVVLPRAVKANLVYFINQGSHADHQIPHST
jgi:hypothetical protein